MGTLLKDTLGQQLVGGGRRASTLRSHVRGAIKFLSWLALNRELSYATSFDQLSEFLQVRLSEPCNSGALKGTHQSFVFLEEMVGTAAQERFTRSALYGVIYRELLSSAQPGKPVKQAFRMLSPNTGFSRAVSDERDFTIESAGLLLVDAHPKVTSIGCSGGLPAVSPTS